MALALHPWQNQTCLFSYIPYSTRLEALGWGGDLFGSGATHSYFAKLPLRPFFFYCGYRRHSRSVPPNSLCPTLIDLARGCIFQNKMRTDSSEDVTKGSTENRTQIIRVKV